MLDTNDKWFGVTYKEDKDYVVKSFAKLIEDGVYQKYLPHMTAYTNSSNNTNDQGGRPTTDNPTENTIRSRNNNGNNIPSPSDSK